MLWTNLLLDLVLACFVGPWALSWLGLDRPVADVALYCSAPCQCPKDGACKGCCPNGCTCEAAACTCPAATAACTETAAAPTTPPINFINVPSLPMTVSEPRLYQVQVRMGKTTCPALLLPAGGRAQVEVPSPTLSGAPCKVGVHLDEAEPGSVRVRLQVQKARTGCGGYPAPVLFQCERAIDLDTVTGLVLCGADPEPCCAEVTVRATPAPSAAPPHSAPRSCACTIPPPVPVCPPVTQVVVPDPIPLMPSWSGSPVPAEQPPSRCEVSGQLCVATTTCPASTGTQVRLVRRCGKPRLEMKADGGSTTCVRMTIERGQAGTLVLAAGKKHVHVKGKMWKACADEVEIHGDGRVTLRGTVKLLSDKIGVCASVKADKLSIQVKQGRLDRIIEQ